MGSSSRKASPHVVAGVRTDISFGKVVQSDMPEMVAGNTNSNRPSSINDSRRTLKGKETYKGRDADLVASDAISSKVAYLKTRILTLTTVSGLSRDQPLENLIATKRCTLCKQDIKFIL